MTFTLAAWAFVFVCGAFKTTKPMTKTMFNTCCLWRKHETDLSKERLCCFITLLLIPLLFHFCNTPLHPLLPPPALKDDRFQMELFTPRVVRITLTNVSVSDEGGYFCQLYTDATHHQVAILSVLVPPEVPAVEVKQEAVEGGVAELTCVSPRSKPAATLRWTWIRNGKEIPGTRIFLTGGLIDG